jgi:hypothetical protein
MKKTNSNIGTWILSSIGAVAVALSIVVLLPTVSKANNPPAGKCTAECGSSGSVTCSGSECGAEDNVGCHWFDDTGFHFRSC